MNNNQQTQKPVMTKEALKAGLYEVPVALNISGAQFTETTTSLITKIEQVFREFCGLSQLVQVAMKPTLTRDGLIDDLDITFYLDTNLRGEDGIYISRGRLNGGNNEGTIMQFRNASNSMRNGGFEMSESFKKAISPFYLRVNPKDKTIPTTSLNSNPNIAVIRMDAIAVFELLLGINQDTPYSVSIIAGQPVGGYGDSAEEHVITFTKNIETGRYNRKRKTTIDCTKFDPVYSKGRGGRHNGGNQNHHNNNNSYNEDRSY